MQPIDNKVLGYSISYKLSEVGSYDLEKNDTVKQANLIPSDTRIVGKLDADFYNTDGLLSNKHTEEKYHYSFNQIYYSILR